MTSAMPDFSGVHVTSGGVICTDDGACQWEAPPERVAHTPAQPTPTKENTPS